MDRPHLIDLRRDRTNLAEIGLQVIVIEPIEPWRPFRRETNDELGGRASSRTQAEHRLPVEEPKYAAVDGDLGAIPPPIGEARFWPFRARRKGQGGKNLQASKI